LSRKKPDGSISAALASATCALLGTTTATPVDAQEEPRWDFSTSLLYYGEDEGRVQDLSFKSLSRRLFTDDRVLILGLTVDTLTGASPNGAIRQDRPQTFTRPSGNAAYTVAAGELPLDDTFRDTRVSISANWQQPAGEKGLVNVGLSASKEYDYLHTGLNARYAHDFNKRNTTVSAGFAYARDSIEPVGGAPTPLTPMLDVGDVSNRGGDDDKDVLDVVFGVSQVINRDLVVQANYSFSRQDGYLNNPYKVLSLVDSVTGDTLPRLPAPQGGPDGQFLFENRPDQRTQHALFTQAKYNLKGKVLDVSYRYATDDWEIDSHTLDLRYRWPVGDANYLEPHVRYYTQTEAEFYRVSLDAGEPLPAYASPDYRLGNFDGITVGLKYGWKTRNDHDMSVRVEWYTQSGDVPDALLIGNQRSRDNFPDLNALIVQFSYRFSR
jgi:hypothetical protein